jgi:3D (Asp-Asp-Asp) domain-containing protein
MIKKVILTTISFAAVLAAGIGFSSVTASANIYRGAAASYHYQPQTSTYSQSAPVKNTSVASQTTNTSSTAGATISVAQFESQGVVYLNGNKWTYYSGSLTADGTSISANGLDPNGYRVVAAPANVAFGTKIMTPLGMGVVHDRGTAITGNHYDVVIQ